jgi:hypothetical protein
MRLIPALLAMCVLIYLGVTELPSLLGTQAKQDSLLSSGNKPEEFEIIKENTKEEASYISVVYLDG